MDSPSHTTVLRSPRPSARALRLSSSFKPLSEAVRASGATTPTGILLGKASDIITSSIGHGFDEKCASKPEYHPVGLTHCTGSPIKSCLSLGRRSDSPVPLENAAAAHSAERKGLHWKPEPVAASAVNARFESRELQARYMKLEADLQESEAARVLLQKQLHRVQDAMRQNRDDLEDAQRAALAAEAKAAAAEAKAVTSSAEVCMQITASAYHVDSVADSFLTVDMSLQVRQLPIELAKGNIKAQYSDDKVCRQAQCCFANNM